MHFIFSVVIEKSKTILDKILEAFESQRNRFSYIM